ncbi:uncharacterized protein LOC110032518 [Phalaenopsis equestris]|uniref:uncharacterized protein LOC110032518 n=1 Tax=Phalaenopsis equestris TaxID=78828 RepID=UPI0009E30DF4|nr:uncharacterized protein LOC110032518 [Phalaenopsis equestris]
MWFLNLMGCSDHRRRRRSNKHFPSLLGGAEEPAATEAVEPVVIRAKSSRLPQWQPALAAISEDDAAAAADNMVGRREIPAMIPRRGSVKTSSRVRPQAAAEKNTWHHNNQRAIPSLSPAAAFFMF